MKHLIFLVLLLLPLAPRAGAPEIAATLVQARKGGAAWPLVSASGITGIAEAYAIQGEVVRGQAFRVGGYKAGLTTPSLRARYQVDEPIFGVLPAAGRLEVGADLDRASFRLAKLEMEVAFILGAPVTGRVADVAALKHLVFAVAPAVEIPDLAFADLSTVTGPDLVAANVAAARFVLGQERIPSDVVMSDINPVLRRGGEEILRGRFSDADGDPWNSLLWLVNKALAEGYSPGRGDVFLSGALGGMAPAEPGRHEADFGPLGRISLLIR